MVVRLTSDSRQPYQDVGRTAPRRVPADLRTYPFQKILVSLGILVGIATAAMFGDILIGAILFVGFVCTGLLWRRSEVPIFAFCVLYQWLFIGVGYVYFRATGEFPGMRHLGDLDIAIVYSLLGLVCLTLGIRFSLHTYRPDPESSADEYAIDKLFWIVLILFSINWFTETSVVQFRLTAFNIAQILHNILILRYLFLYLLLLAIVQQGRQYSLGFLAFAYVLMPELTSSMTKFKELFFLLVVVLLSQWRPFSTDFSDQTRNRNILIIVTSVTVLLVAAGLVWTGGMKQNWRSALLSGQVSGSPIEKIEAYGQHAVDSVERFDPGPAVKTLASRMSSGVAYFSHVVRVVPDVVPHEDGKLTWSAIEHVAMPRVLFPEKPDLGGDSWLVRKYARLNVSGSESKTSVGLGYMAEFFIDFGFPGMLVPLVLYGMLLGGIFRAVSNVSPSPAMFYAIVSGLFLQHFLSYEGNFVKLLGGVLQNFLIFYVALALFGRRAHELFCSKATSASGSKDTLRYPESRYPIRFY